MIFGALIGAGASLLGANKAKKAADADRALTREQMEKLASVEFNPQNVSGPFGAGVTFGPGGPQFNAGGFAPFFDAFSQGGLGGLGQVGGFDQAGQNLFAQGLGTQLDALGGLSSINPFATHQAFSQLAQADQLSQGTTGRAMSLLGGGLRRGTQDALFGRAAAGPRAFGDLRTQELDLLRQEAAPHEERAFQNLQESQFATGRLGSSGGALQTEAFARGLGQADLARQRQATATAQQQQALDLQDITRAGQLGLGLQAGENQALRDAFAAFAQPASFARGFGQDQLAQQQFAANLAQSQFGMGANIFGQGAQQFDIANQMFGRGINAAQAMGGLFNPLLALGEFGANLGATAAKTDLAKHGGQANFMSQMGPSGRDLTANFLTQAGSSLFNQSGGLDSVGKFFGNLSLGKPMALQPTFAQQAADAGVS